MYNKHYKKENTLSILYATFSLTKMISVLSLFKTRDKNNCSKYWHIKTNIFEHNQTVNQTVTCLSLSHTHAHTLFTLYISYSITHKLVVWYFRFTIIGHISQFMNKVYLQYWTYILLNQCLIWRLLLKILWQKDKYYKTILNSLISEYLHAIYNFYKKYYNWCVVC